MTKRVFTSFQEFYPFYLGEHSLPMTKLFHLVGTTGGLTWWLMALLSVQPMYFVYGLVMAYSLAWFSHYFIEQNRPATFNHPLYSFRGDLQMAWESVLGQHTLW